MQIRNIRVNNCRYCILVAKIIVDVAIIYQYRTYDQHKFAFILVRFRFVNSYEANVDKQANICVICCFTTKRPLVNILVAKNDGLRARTTGQTDRQYYDCNGPPRACVKVETTAAHFAVAGAAAKTPRHGLRHAVTYAQ